MTNALMRIAKAGGRTGHAMRIALLMLLGLAAFLPGIANLPPTDRDESRYMQASRQMVASGDWIDIRFQNAPRYLKPVGIYWMQAAAVKLVGGGAEPPIWAYRLVSVASVLVAVLGIYVMGVYLFGPATGLLAGITMTGSLEVLFEARMAKTDAALMAATVVTLAALAFVYLSSKRDQNAPLAAPWLFWLAMGAGILIKGPITPLAAMLTTATILIFDKDRRWVWRLRPGRGFLLMVAVVAPWLVAITLRSGTVFWSEALGQMLLKVRSGYESQILPPGYYMLTYSLMFWPFALEAVRAGLKSLNVARSDPRLLFCLAWYIPFWLVFELITTKLPHYVLPAYPAAFLILGWGLADPGGAAVALKRWQVWLVWLATFGWIVVTIGLAVIAASLVPYVTGEISAPGLLAALLALLAGWLGSGFAPPAPPLPRMLLATLAAAAFAGLLTSCVLPAAKPIWAGERIAEAFQAHRPCPQSVLAVAGFYEPSVVLLAGTKTIVTNGLGAAYHLKRDPACAMAAVASADEPLFHSAFAGGEQQPQRVVDLAVINYTKGTALDIALYRMPTN